MANIDLNTAGTEELSKVEGIGQERAEQIVRMREERGGFKSWDDLKQVPGFSDKMVADLQKKGAKISGEEEDMEE
ncbi:MAG TPA: helix-hairpin-helix domain-containing protein [Patescibacteria group bacterium]|nr:helix-hairpin-helix domain-containing protein [Patescibacteria group bacterium]